MKNLYLDAGILRDQVTLYDNQESHDGCGGYEDNWVVQGTLWSRITPATASSIVRIDNEEQVSTHIVELRQPLDIKPGMRLTATNTERAFSVLTVFDPDETRRYWRCKCRLEDDQ